MCSDAVLLLLGVIAFVVSQYVLDSVVRTTVWYAGAGNIVQYYTLSSLYETFSDVVSTGLHAVSRTWSGLPGAVCTSFAF